MKAKSVAVFLAVKLKQTTEVEPAAGADVGAGPEPSDRQFGVWFMVPVAGAERDVKTNSWFFHHLPASTCMQP
jgi:hypothetical protein